MVGCKAETLWYKGLTEESCSLHGSQEEEKEGRREEEEEREILYPPKAGFSDTALPFRTYLQTACLTVNSSVDLSADKDSIIMMKPPPKNSSSELKTLGGHSKSKL